MRLARFNIQTSGISDKRYFVGLPSPTAAAITASTVFMYPWGLQNVRVAIPCIALMLVPAFLMVSTIRFRSIKAIDVGWRRSPFFLFLAVVVPLALIVWIPRIALVVLSYAYVLTALAIYGYQRLRRRPAPPVTAPVTAAAVTPPPPSGPESAPPPPAV
jgi:CDP-diacylglycerol--serine O-phosphatidyltransferase